MAESPFAPKPAPAPADPAPDADVTRRHTLAGQPTPPPADTPNDPFAAFSEWAGAIDAADFVDL